MSNRSWIPRALCALLVLLVCATGCADGAVTSSDAGTADGDGSACTPGAKQVCGSARGICERGTKRCNQGFWGPCRDSVPPQGEVCDGKDNDCNGAVDDLPSCGGDAGVDAADDTDTSSGETDSADGCRTDAGTEACDGEDNDCDGRTDENLSEDCPKQMGVCSGASVSCSGGSYPSCTAADYGSEYEMSESSCDGKDNDCNGTVDDVGGTTKEFGFEGSDPTGWGKFPSGFSDLNVDSDATTGGAAQGSEYAKAWFKHGVCRDAAGFAATVQFGSIVEQIEVQVRADIGNWGRTAIFLSDSSGNRTKLWLANAKGNGYTTNGWKKLTFDRTTSFMKTTSSGAEITQKNIPPGVGMGEITLIFGNDDNTGHCSNSDHTWKLRADAVKITGTCP